MNNQIATAPPTPTLRKKAGLNFKVLLLFLLLLTLLSSVFITINWSKYRKGIVTVGYTSAVRSELTRINLFSKGVEYEQASLALQDLNDNKINIALIERRAKASELLSDYYEYQLSSGMVLVSRQEKIISEKELENAPIHTYLDLEIAKSYFPNHTNIIKHDSIGIAAVAGLSQLLFIPWTDYNDSFNLVSIQSNNQDSITFHTPFLYSYQEIDENLLNFEK